MEPFILDKCGFPMAWVESLQGYIHCLPVTKVQFEYFLCDSPSPDFDERWYEEILTLNPRVSVRNVNKTNYWRLFLTGIKPDEVEQFAEWCGSDYQPLTTFDWATAFQSFSKEPFEENILSEVQLDNRQSILFKRVFKTVFDMCRNQATRSEQFLFRWGVVEWVRCNNLGQDWGGLGQTINGFQASLRTAEMKNPEIPRNPHGNRLHYYGFRLIKKV